MVVPHPDAVTKIASRALGDLGVPGVDRLLGMGVGGILLAHVVGQRPAAALVGVHHLDPVPVVQPDRRRVEVRPQHALGAAAQQGDALGRLPARRRETGPAGWSARGAASRRAPGRAWRRGGCRPAAAAPPARGRASELGGGAGEAEPVRVRQDLGEQRPQEPVAGRAARRSSRYGPGMVDEVHVVHPGRAGVMHDRQERQRSICLTTSCEAGCRPQHVLDQVDAAARRIELVASSR